MLKVTSKALVKPSPTLGHRREKSIDAKPVLDRRNAGWLFTRSP
jgi:hypothetical protein